MALPLRVVIVHGRTGEACDAECGMDWSLPENKVLADKTLGERFGSSVKAEYIGLSDHEAMQRYPEIFEKVQKEKMPMPLLVINGAIRINGYFDIRMLIDMVDAEIEMEN